MFGMGVENLFVGLVVAVALFWGARSLWLTVRSVKAAGEAPPPDGACTTGQAKGAPTKITAGCGCSAAGSCPAADRCAAPGAVDPAAVSEHDPERVPAGPTR